MVKKFSNGYEYNKVYNEDCLEGMKKIPDGEVDIIICDLPYGVTNKSKNKWDEVIPLDKLWEQYNRVIKEDGAIILFGQDKFSARVMLSNERNHRYNLIWDKELVTGFLNANRMPLRVHEDIMVFYKKLPTYNPQKVKGKKNHSRGEVGKGWKNSNYGEFKIEDNHEKLGDLKHPKSIIKISKPHPSKTIHPTQKPVELIEWLLKSYSKEGDIMLDNCMGSGTSAIASINSGRNYIGYEIEESYYNKIIERIDKHKKNIKK